METATIGFMGNFMLISAFLSPILFLALKKYMMGLFSLVSIVFAYSMLNAFQHNIDMATVEAKSFVVATMLLNICAVTIGIMKIKAYQQKHVVTTASEEEKYEDIQKFETAESNSNEIDWTSDDIDWDTINIEDILNRKKQDTLNKREREVEKTTETRWY